MAYQKLQAGRAIKALVTNNTIIPNPATKVVFSFTTSTGTNVLIDTTKNFIDLGVKIGDIVYTNTDSAYVTSVSSNTLGISFDLFGLYTDAYTLYSNVSNECPVLYVGGGGDLIVETEGGDIVTFVGFPSGGFLPVYVKRIISGSAVSNVIALF